ncbi:M16 family metallopeptidase [Mesoterricola silvestris]|uniref:Peptidase M16 n=1 Tax=Mesoterricola silvestris TaxID=2927979 RepID=A0AA48GLR0_9BACT|nr:pitrilysin family protein [Mesoterricola silvestris]BDU72134.1 peptidase M16 [Mesoterricola silvestris]
MIPTPGRVAAAALCALAPLAAQDLPVTERTLPNGMRVLLVERHDEPTIACGWVARVGSADERPGITGIAHLFEHMMFKGTKVIGTRNPARDAELNALQDRTMEGIRAELDLLRERLRRGEIQDLNDPKVRSPRHQRLLGELDALVKEQRGLIVKDELDKVYKQAGATGLNANTTPDRTFFHIQVPANKLELWAWLEADRIRNAVFREFYSERDVVLEERRLRVEATPTGKVQETFNAMVWQAHPYTWPVIGWPSDIATVTRDQADTFFSTYYAPNNITAILVGDFRTEEAFGLVKAYFGAIPGRAAVPPKVTTLEPPQGAEQRLEAAADAMPMVQCVHKGVPSVHRDAPALDVLSAVLNGNSGRLNRELVIGRKVAVDAGAGNNSMKFGGLFYLGGVPAPGHTPEEVERLLLQEVERIQKDGITERELQKVKNQVQAATYGRMENNMDLLSQLAEAEGAGTYKDFLADPAHLAAVTREDVQRVARQYFVPGNRSTLVIRRKEAK